MNFEEMLSIRSVPTLSFDGLDRLEEKRSYIKELIQQKEYGALPEKPEHLSISLLEEDSRYAAGKARKQDIKITLINGDRSFSFGFCQVVPNISGKIPAFVYIGSSPALPDKFIPIEEIIDNGFAVFSFCAEDVTSDSPIFNGISTFLKINRRSASAPGKLMLWTYAAMRIMDYVESLDFIDKEHVAVIGHSRLAISALLAAALDERFKYAVANNSGCCGAAISKGKSGEQVHDIVNRFPYLFSPKFKRLIQEFGKSEFDQNFLLSLIAPRKLLIGSAENDLRSDPVSEFLGACSVSGIYKLYGETGLVDENKFPKAPLILDKGSICYHIRKGEQYLSRDDWQVYMNYIKKNTEKTK